MIAGNLVTVERQIPEAPLGEFEYCVGILINQPVAQTWQMQARWRSWNVLVDGILVNLPMRMIEVV